MQHKIRRPKTNRLEALGDLLVPIAIVAVAYLFIGLANCYK